MKPPQNLASSLMTFLQSHERVFGLLVALVIGMVTGLAAVALRFLIEFLHEYFWKIPEYFDQFIQAGWLGIILVPALGGLLVGPLIYFLAPEAKGHGVPEVMASVLRKGGFIRPRVAWVKAVSSAITIASGGSVGREGPIIQIGSSIGSTLGYLLHLPPRMMRTFVACGAAGGIAAAFNAPIAGSLFAVEIILGDFGFIQLAPIVTSAVVATVISRGVEGDFAAFGVPAYSLENPLELIMYVGLGLLSGIAAVSFIQVLDKTESFFDNKVKFPEWGKPVLGGLVVGLIGLFWPQVFGVGYQAIDSALNGGLPLMLLGVLVIAKLAATSITLASGGSGGIFAPSLFMGAMLGGVVGKLANWIMPGIAASSGAYALVGMAAMVGAATHAPITAIVIIFELTNDYKIILPLMISTIIGVLTASTLNKDSIYTHKLRRKGINIDEGLESNVLKRVRVRDVMRTDIEPVPQDLPFNFLVDQLLQTSRSHVPVVTEQGRMLGKVTREIAQRFIPDKILLSDIVIARDVADKQFIYLLPGDSLDQVWLRFNECGMRELYVMQDTVSMKLVGVVRKGDLTDAFQQEMARLSSGEVFSYNINHSHQMETVKVMDGFAIIEVESPHDFSGKLLRDLDLRNRYGINVLAIKRNTHEGEEPITRMWVPESSDQLEDGDFLVLLGKTEDIDKLQRNW